ncbi:MAG TPA: hypothetical protein VKU38_17500 [Ktedonobacteraceae bacterium]|nr:hypothetical protein [Ktedonobacteraceae bacterium]
MILCSNCGSQVPEVLASCQFCGTAVPGVANATNRSGANAYAPKQPELPAWLETLRSSERPPTPASSESAYSLPGSIDENDLPSWMRSDKMDNSARMPAIRPASRPAPNTEGNLINSAGMSASSLIDEQSLPSWMQEPHAPSQLGQESIPAASLVQPEALPGWMKAVPPQALSSPPAPQMPPTQPISGQMSYSYTPPAVPQQRLSGNDLIDQQTLPSWMSSQTPGIPAQGNGPGNVIAGSLIDPNALPPWLREGVQQEQRGVNMPPRDVPGAPVPQPAPSMQSVQPMQQAQPASMNNSISASSFIDVDALPGWLRSAEEQRGASSVRSGNNSDQNRPGGFGAPARVENMRVPSRPRAEMPSLEESAVAANVFASMLGVASGNVPGQPQNGQFPPVTYPAQSPVSPANNPNNGTSNTSGTSGSNWAGFPEGMPSSQLPPLVPPPGYGMSASPNMSNGQNGQGFSAPGLSQQSMPGSFQGNQVNQRNSGMPQQVAGNNFQSKQPTGSQQKQSGKKRGFLETILNWFSR